MGTPSGFRSKRIATVAVCLLSFVLFGCGGSADDGEVTVGKCDDYQKGGAGPVSDGDSCKEACVTGEGFSDGNVSKWEGPKMFATEDEAKAEATDYGCEGAHKMGGQWMPGATHGACRMGKCDCRQDESSDSWVTTCDEKRGGHGGHGGHNHHEHHSHGNGSARMLDDENAPERLLYA